jgi:hypothetical protein
MLDIFNNRLTLNDILYNDAWFIQELYESQLKYLEEKRKAEMKAALKAQEEAKVKAKSKK